MVMNFLSNPKFRAAAVDLAGEVVKSFVTTRMNRAISSLRVGPLLDGKVSQTNYIPQGESPPSPDAGCPYCGAAKRLSAAHRYLQRAQERPGLTHVYQELARTQVVAAGKSLNDANVVTSPEVADLLHQIVDIQSSLSSAPGPERVKQITQKTWAASSQALDLAEGYKDAQQTGECLASEMEQAVHDLDSRLNRWEDT